MKCESMGAEVRAGAGDVMGGESVEGGVTQQMRLAWQGLMPETSIFFILAHVHEHLPDPALSSKSILLTLVAFSL